MKTSQEIVAHLIDVIANIYRRPQMYASTPCGLDGALHDYHYILDYALDRQGASMSAIAELYVNELGSTVATPDGWNEAVSSPESPAFQDVISKWKKVDLRLGLGIPVDIP